MNSKKSYAFSDRLIEYLLNNVIHSHDEYSSDIAAVQSSLRLVDKVYKNTYDTHNSMEGVWDNSLQQSVLRVLEQYSTSFQLQDQDGNINKDVENLLVRIGGKYRE